MVRANKLSLTLAGGAAVFALVAWAFWTLRPGSDAGEAIGLQADDEQLVAQGQGLYVQHCAACHGAGLEGQPNWRQRKADGKLPAPPHDHTGHTWHHPDAVLFNLTKFGPAAVAGGNYASEMPAYEGTLSDHDIIAVLSYIKSTWPAEFRFRHDQLNQPDR